MKGTPSISVVIPALHEEAGINALLRRLRSLDADDALQIIVSDGDPAGSTIGAIGIPGIITAAGPPGRGGQMNRGAALATGDILLFLHADTVPPHDAFDRIRSCMNDRSIVGGCFDLGIDSPRRLFRVTERYVALRTRITRVPFGDQAIFLRRSFFERIGGYRNIPLMEDIELMSRIRAGGSSICIIPSRVSTSARRWERDGILFATCRNMLLQLLYCLGIPPERLARFYR